jgi:hypothetical protein
MATPNMGTLKPLPSKNPKNKRKPLVLSATAADQPQQIFDGLSTVLQELSDPKTHTIETFDYIMQSFKANKRYTQISPLEILSITVQRQNGMFFTGFEYQYKDIKTEDLLMKTRIQLNRFITTVCHFTAFNHVIFELPTPPIIRDDIGSGCYMEDINHIQCIAKYVRQDSHAYREGHALSYDATNSKYKVQLYNKGNLVNEICYDSKCEKLYEVKYKTFTNGTTYVARYTDNKSGDVNHLRGPHLHGRSGNDKNFVDFSNSVPRKLRFQGVHATFNNSNKITTIACDTSLRSRQNSIETNMIPQFRRIIYGYRNDEDTKNEIREMLSLGFIGAGARLSEEERKLIPNIPLLIVNGTNANFKLRTITGRFTIFDPENKVLCEGDTNRESQFDGVIVYYRGASEQQGLKFNGSKYAILTYYNNGVMIDNPPYTPQIQQRIKNHNDLYLPFDLHSQQVVQLLLNKVVIRPLVQIVADYLDELVNVKNNVASALQY